MRTLVLPGEDIGEEFPYPKSLKQLAMATPAAQAPAPPPAPATTPDAVDGSAGSANSAAGAGRPGEEMTGSPGQVSGACRCVSRSTSTSGSELFAPVDAPESPPAEQQPAELPNRKLLPHDRARWRGVAGFAGCLD